MTRRLLVAAVAALGLLVFAGAAGAATTLGIVAPPTGSSAASCNSGPVIGQRTDDPTTPYLIPSGGGKITQWQTYTANDTAGTKITMMVLRPSGTGSYTVVGLDTETLPNPLPAGNVASFSLSSPIAVDAGDTLALSANAAYACYYYGGDTPSADVLFEATPALPLTSGETVSPGSLSPAQYTLNLAVTLVPPQDAGVQSSTFPSVTDVSSGALLRSVVTNGGPGTAPINFADQVPAGLQVQSASTGAGSCAVSGQTVSCTISGLAAGQSTTVDVVVTPTAAGTFLNNVSVGITSGATDPDSANNSASATLTVTSLPQKCIVPGLRRLPLASARALLRELGCKVKVAHQHSKLRSGLVIGVRGGARTYPFQTLVTVIASSGPKRKRG